LIISRISGLSLGEFISKHVWTRLHPEHDASILTDAAFNPIATGGFNSTLRDFARFGLAVIDDGKFEGQQIFPAKWIEQTFLLTDAEVKAGQKSKFKDTSSKWYYDKLSGYKNFWWIHDSNKKIMMAKGIYGQGLYIDKSRNVVIATFASAPTPSNVTRDTWKTKVHAMQTIAESLSD
jgi:CubicO group peptidase (beta-lactamase class C family)